MVLTFHAKGINEKDGTIVVNKNTYAHLNICIYLLNCLIVFPYIESSHTPRHGAGSWCKALNSLLIIFNKIISSSGLNFVKSLMIKLISVLGLFLEDFG